MDKFYTVICSEVYEQNDLALRICAEMYNIDLPLKVTIQVTEKKIKKQKVYVQICNYVEN